MESAIVIALLGATGMIACLFFAMRPLWATSGTGGKGWRASTVWSEWLDRKDTLLFNLEDLAHEQRLGKISQEDYARLQAGYKKELVSLLDLMEHSEPPVEFQSFLLSLSIAAQAGPSDRVCFSCQAFYKEDFSFCPKCGGALTVRS